MKAFLLVLSLVSTAPTVAPRPAPAPTATVTVRNRLPLARSAETISLPLARLPAALRALAPASLRVRDAATQALLVTQLLDADDDGQPDELLFQTDVPARGRKAFVLAAGPEPVPVSAVTTFSRFVPERIDDYAWENERVAFRTYGPVAQQRTEAGRKDGTLTSGMDCWLKRVPYPIIDKWYAGNLQQASYYHKDRGEGYDPYHVGDSRGCGGTGVWDQGRLYVSKNFIRYKTLATGPIRTVFELTYAPWDANGRPITETKRISLDLGSNLSRYEDHISSPAPLPNYVAGITLHQKLGTVRADQKAGWFRHWEPIDDGELGTGIVLDPRTVLRYEDHRVDQADQSQLLVFARPTGRPLVFYAGFGWTKSGQFRTAQEWDDYLRDFAQRLASPLAVQVSN